MSEYPEDGAWPGVRSPNLSKDPLGLAGELTIGPDDLDPDKPRDREALKEMGFDIVDYDERDDMEIEETEINREELEPSFDFWPHDDSEPKLVFDAQEDNNPFTLW